MYFILNEYSSWNQDKLPRSNSPYRIRREFVGSCRNPNDRIPTRSSGYRIFKGSDRILVIPTLSDIRSFFCRNPVVRIPITSDEFPSNPIKFDNFSDIIRCDPTVGSNDLGSSFSETSKTFIFNTCNISLRGKTI